MDTPSQPLAPPCACNAPLGPTDFRTAAAFDHWVASGRCQWCQDAAALTAPDTHAVPSPIRQGAVVAHSPTLDEVVFLPLRFGDPARPVVWEARHLLRVGPALAPLDPAPAFASMRAVLAGQRIDATLAPALDTPWLARLLSRTALVLAAHSPRLADVVGACPALWAAAPSVHPLGFGDVDTGEAISLERFIVSAGLDPDHGPDARAPVAPLRLCAWLGAALTLPTPDGASLLGHILRARFGAGPPVLNAFCSVSPARPE